ncbi:ankyrin repeat domain-containing protein [Winogradskyella endarachnes]|uniref:Ankyrin repeat domain-containing protein n=1 Tax=Winogradskyella endarachnes TaxID=2681965 RepID=A0A6L6UEZ3_9FLAO|nr:ankyrin repeat domain-containing protein [Winogradskyella endarachnes]MUU79417.1 ankyrin repeat domain-containing protein [Winogradskyella endarachnes]
MKKIKSYLAFLALAISLQGIAQSNVFLDREFWDTKPTVETLKLKIKEGNNASEANSYNFDGVVYAILQNAPFESIVYLMSQKGNDVNKLTHDGRTYVFWAAYKGNAKLVEYLLENGAKTDITDDKGNTIVTFAAGAGQQNTEVYELCFKKDKTLVTKTNPDGANALLLAAPSDKDFKLVKYFQSRGLGISSKDYNDNGIFNYVARGGNIDLMKKLVKDNITGTDQAFIFVANGTRGKTNGIDVYEYLSEIGLNPNVVNKAKVSPLHIAASKTKDLGVFYFLLENKLNARDKDSKGNDALMLAASKNSLNVIKVLYAHSKSVNETNRKGQSALTFAVQGNSEDVIEFLIKKGSKTAILDADGNNLAYYLIDSYSKKNQEEFYNKLNVLQTNNVDLTASQKNGNTWYHLAVEKNSLELLKLATEFDLDINAKNVDGNTALHLAALKAKDDTILKFLLENGADKKLLTDFEESAYDLASENELLSQKKISIKFLK